MHSVGTNGKPGVVAEKRRTKIASLPIEWRSIQKRGGRRRRSWFILEYSPVPISERLPHCLYFWLVDISQISNKFPFLLERLLLEGSL